MDPVGTESSFYQLGCPSLSFLAKEAAVSFSFRWTLILILVISCWIIFQKKRATNATKQLPGPNSFWCILIFMKLYLRGRLNIGFLPFLNALARVYYGNGAFLTMMASGPFAIFYDAEQIEVLLKNTNFSERPEEYPRFYASIFGNALGTMSSESEWRKRRKLLSVAFRPRILQEYIPAMNKSSKILVKKLMQCAPDDPIDIRPLVQRCALDIICESLMGVNTGCQENNCSADYHRALQRALPVLILREALPWLYPDFIFYNLPIGRKFKQEVKTIRKFTAKMISERKEKMLKNEKVKLENESSENDQLQDFSITRNMTFMDFLLHHHLYNKTLTIDDVQAEVTFNTYAGHDTTTATISWALFLIASYPDVQKRVHQELDEIFAGDNEREITYDDVKQMNYLKCVINETMRLYPPGGAIPRILKKDLSIGKYTVPSGTKCLLFAYQLHRNPKYFPNPEVFQPERFLYSNDKDRHPFSFIPYSAGPINCIGQVFAQNEQLVVVSDVLRNFSLRAAHDIDKVLLSFDVVFKPAKPMRVYVTPRN